MINEILFIMYADNSGNNIIYRVIEGVLLVFVLLLIVNKSKKNILEDDNLNKNENVTKSVSKVPLYEEVSEEEFNKIIPDYDINKFKDMIFNLYKDIMVSYMNSDKDKIKELTTDDMYNYYSTQINILNAKMQKYIIEDIELIEDKIISVSRENNVDNIEIYLNYRCYDYIVKESNHIVVKGRDNRKLNITYILTINKIKDKYVLSKRKVIGQHIE